MNNIKLIDLINEYRKESNDNNFKKIEKKLTALINEYLPKVSKEDMQDIRQELLMIILNKVKFASINYTYLPDSLFTDDNLKLLKENNYSIESFNKYFNNKYVQPFLYKYGVSKFEEAFIDLEVRKDFIYNFAKEGANNKFYGLLRKSFKSFIISFYRKQKNNLSLNNYIEKNIEYIEIIKEEEEHNFEFDWEIFELEDRKFLFECFNDERVLTQKEIAKKLNITQQAVSRRIKRIRNKYQTKIKNF